MNRVTPSSKLSAIWKLMAPPPAAVAWSDVIDIDDVVDVVVLQDDLLALDERALAGRVELIERRAEIAVGRLVAEAEGDPVEAQRAGLLRLPDDLDIADVVGRPRFRQAGGARSLRLDPEHSV